MNHKKIEVLKSLISDLEKKINELRKEVINEYGDSLRLISKFMLVSFNDSEIRRLVRLIGKENELPDGNCSQAMIANIASMLFLETENGIDILFDQMVEDRPRKEIEIFQLEKKIRELLNDQPIT